VASIEKRSENTYRIVVSAGYDTNGKKLREYRTVTLSDGMTERQREKELNRQAVLFEREVENGTYLDGTKITFAEFAKTWLIDYAEKRLAPGTLNPYKMRLEKRIIPAIGHIKLAKIQPHHLMEFYNNLQEDGMRLDARYTPTDMLIKLLKPMPTSEVVKLSGISFKTVQSIKKGNPSMHETAEKLSITLGVSIKKMFACDGDKKLSDKTLRHHHGIISSILSTAVKWGVIVSNPAERVDLGKATKYKPNYYDDKQIKAMFAALAGEPLHYKTMVYLTIDTGMRSGEVTGLLWSEVDLDKGFVIVNKQRQYVSGYGTIEKDPKTENGFRTITLSETVVTLLRQYKNRQIKDMFKLGTVWKHDRQVFLHEDGTPMHPHRPYKWFTEFLERHNLLKITYHQLRHTNASLLISAGVDVVTLSGRLGHGDKNVTLNTYSHIIKSKEEQAANLMDIFYSRAAEKA
jgi:Site-specific recombinase XerD